MKNRFSTILAFAAIATAMTLPAAPAKADVLMDGIFKPIIDASPDNRDRPTRKCGCFGCWEEPNLEVGAIVFLGQIIDRDSIVPRPDTSLHHKNFLFEMLQTQPGNGQP